MATWLKTVCLPAATAALSSAALAADVTITPTVAWQETFSDNVDLEPSGQEDPAIISEVLPGFSLRSNSPRVTSSLDAAADLRHQAGGESGGVEVLPRLTGVGNLEAIEDLFFIDAGASISQQLLNTRQGDTQSNRDTLQTYRLSPYLTNRFGSFARSELRYVLTQILAEDQLSDSTDHQLSLAINSGNDFQRVLWSLSGRASKEERSDSGDVERRDATLGLQYVVDRTFSLLGDVGYQQFKDGDSANEFDSVTWQAGFRWAPGPRTDLAASYGRVDNAESLSADLTYRIGARTTLRATYDRSLQTGQSRLARALQSIGSDTQSGQIVDATTGLPFNPNPNPTSLIDATTRTETLTVGLNGASGRNTFGVTGTYQKSNEEGSGADRNDEEAIAVNSTVGRQLSPELSAQAYADYAHNSFENEGREDDTYRLGGALGYSIYTNVQANLTYQYTLRDSSQADDDYSENRVTVGLRMTF